MPAEPDKDTLTTVALLTTQAPDPLTDQLSLAGYRVVEALWADEVFHLMETEHVDVVVIKTGLGDPEIPELQKKIMPLVLDSGATAADSHLGIESAVPAYDSQFIEQGSLAITPRTFLYLVLSFSLCPTVRRLRKNALISLPPQSGSYKKRRSSRHRRL
jgi:hypothetical protein